MAGDACATVAHELGHVLGLDHVTKQCSVMNYAREAVCQTPPQPWQLRCRLLEADDVRGAISRYGGRARPLATEFCDTAPPPAAPTELTVTFDGAERAVAISWRNAGTPTLRAVRLALTSDSCATEPGRELEPGEARSRGQRHARPPRRARRTLLRVGLVPRTSTSGPAHPLQPGSTSRRSRSRRRVTSRCSAPRTAASLSFA